MLEHNRKFSSLSLTLIIPLCIFSFWPVYGQSKEIITDFSSHIIINEDSSLTVTETITIAAKGQRIKRGIYRDFPTKYKDRMGKAVRVGFTLKQVLRDGKPEPHHKQETANGIRIYIGDKNVFLSPGVYTYQITYRTVFQLGFFEDYDELCWNVTGNDWEFPIEKVRAAIELPPGTSSIQKTAYTGPKGAKGQDYTVTEGGTSVIFATVQRLKAREGLTIAIAWPKGYVARPTFMQQIWLYVKFDRDLLACSIFLALITTYYLVAWLKVGKDPDKGAIIPRFTPPGHISPAAARFLATMDYKTDLASLTATIINMAVKGYLAIEEDHAGKFSLTTLSDTDKVPLNAEERAVAGELFPLRKRRLALHDSSKKYVKEVVDAKHALYKALEDQFGKRKGYFSRNTPYSMPGCLFSLLFIVGLFWHVVSGNPAASSNEKIGIVIILLFWTMGLYGGFSIAYLNWTAGKKLWSIFGILFGIPFAGMSLLMMYVYNIHVSPVILVTLMIVPILNYLFSELMKAPSPAGQKILDGLEGFKLYLSVAEKERMNLLNPPQETPELFTQYFPYALALDVEQQWSERFASILAQSQYRPSWYQATRPSTSFDQSLSKSFSGALSSAGTLPGSSSGSGGGGSSGGGGGGGGGGGW